MHAILFLVAFAVSFASAQLKRERVPTREGYLKVSTDIEESAVVREPERTVELRGVADNLPPVRTPESVAAEVRLNQSRLSYLYKIWKFKGINGVGGRRYGLYLTINASGEVEKVEVKGPTNRDFVKEIQANVRTWNFSRVKEKRPHKVNLRNLDFLYRRELNLE